MDKFLDFTTGKIILGNLDIKSKHLEVKTLVASEGEITLTPKLTSGSEDEGTVFYCSADNAIYVGTE